MIRSTHGSRRDRTTSPIFEVNNLKTYYFTSYGVVRAIDGVSLTVYPGQTIGIVGESGCGKSTFALSLIRLVPDPPGRIVSGNILLEGKDILAKSEEEMCEIRGSKIAMTFQDPMTFLNPVISVGDQIAEAILLHQPLTKSEAKERAVEMIELVKIPSPLLRSKDYPHQLSGGMRQRILIAMALSCNPKILIADEPTTALDVIIQDEILELLQSLTDSLGTSLILITHDIGLVAQVADTIGVMYAGKIVELGETSQVLSSPLHPYTAGLLESIPSIETKGKRLKSIGGEVPDLINLPPGCRFHPRCRFAEDICHKETPPLSSTSDGRLIECWRVAQSDGRMKQ